MANPKHKLDREEIMSFLLGELEEAETSRIESMFLADPTYSEAIEAAKSQLFAEYKSGRLSPDRSGRFESRLLPNLDEDKRKFEAMLAANEEERLASGTAPETSGRADAKVEPAPGVPPAAAPAKAAVSPATPARAPKQGGHLGKILIVAVVALGGMAAALLMGRNAGNAAETATLSIFSVRGQSQVIVLPKGEEVKLELPLPDGIASPEFSITMYHGETESSLPAARVGDVVRTTVHKADLAAGRYDLELRGSGETGVVGYFSFRK